jgi:hypothetical protein
MRSRCRFIAPTLLVALFARTGFAQQPGPEIRLGPVIYHQAVQNMTLTIPVLLFLSLPPQGPDGPPRLKVRVAADLSDLQAKIGPIVDTVALPTNNCDHFGVDNIVASIWSKKITFDTGAALKLSGNVDVWTCAKNVPCTRVDWDGWIPHVVTFDCNPPITNRNVNQPFDAVLPFHLALAGPRAVALEIGDVAVTLGGSAGWAVTKLFEISGVDIDNRVKAAFDAAVKPDLLSVLLPAEIQRLNPTITQAGFVNTSGALSAEIELEAPIDAQLVGQIVRLILQHRS